MVKDFHSRDDLLRNPILELLPNETWKDNFLPISGLTTEERIAGSLEVLMSESYLASSLTNGS